MYLKTIKRRVIFKKLIIFFTVIFLTYFFKISFSSPPLPSPLSSPLYFYTKLSSRLHESLKDKNNVMLGILVSGPTWDQHQPTRDCGRATGVWIYIRQKRQGGGLWRKPLCVPAGGWGGLHMRFEYQGAAGP